MAGSFIDLHHRAPQHAVALEAKVPWEAERPWLHTPGGIARVMGMELPEDTITDLLRRLRRIEGQVRGIQQMLSEGRDCREVVTQMSAANKALEQAGFTLVAAGLTWCLEDPERSAAEGYDIADVQRMFTKLA
jgi:DNA-binding FrmR family transcriptional regulator